MDLRTRDVAPPDSGVVVDQPIRLSLCEIAGNGCIALTYLLSNYPTRDCPRPLVEYDLPCQTGIPGELPRDPSICCGEVTSFPLSDCESTGDVCVDAAENSGECYDGLEPRRELSCDTVVEQRPTMFCCTRAIEPPVDCERAGFFCGRPASQPDRCPEPFNVQAFDCPIDPASMEKMTCCG